MLRNMNYAQQTAEIKPSNTTTWDRNEKEDMKLAIEYLYDLHEKLSKLHPECRITIHNILQERRY